MAIHFHQVLFSSVQFSFISHLVIQYKIKDNLLTSCVCIIGYKITKKILQFSKHYLVISYDQRYSKSYFSVIRRNFYGSVKLIWK